MRSSPARELPGFASAFRSTRGFPGLALSVLALAGLLACTADLKGGLGNNGPPNQPLQITVTPSSVNLSAKTGDTTLVLQTVDVGNIGGPSLSGMGVGTILYSPIVSGWLTASLGGATLTPTSMTLSASGELLAPGTYVAIVPVISTVSGVNPRNVVVTLNVDPVPAINASPDTVNVSATAGGSNPAPQVVAISNAGSGTLSGLSVGTISYGPGATSWLTASVNPTTAPGTLTLQPATAGLAQGTYTASVPVRSSLSGVKPDTVVVVFGVSAPAVPPSIGLSPAAVTISATAGGADPPPQPISVTNAGGGSLSGLGVGSITYGPGAGGWLTTTINQATAPATFTLQATTGTLAAGTYSATARVSSSQSGVQPAGVAVTFVVSAAAVPPVISVAPANVILNLTAGGANPAPQLINITNSGGGSLNGLARGTITYGPGATGWLSTGAVSNTTAPATLSVQASIAGLAAGTYTGTIPITSTVLGVAAKNINYTLNVSPAATPPAIALAPTNLTFSATAGGGNPASTAVSVSNSGGGSLTGLAVGTIAYGPGATGWLSASVNPATAPATVTLNATTGSLAPGNYTATVPVTSAVASNSPRNISVTFAVAGAPTMVISASTASFTGTVGAPSPSPQTLNVTNSGAGSLAGLSATITYGAGQPTGWLAASLSSPTTPAVLVLAATTGSLGTGTYTATVSVSTTTSGVASKSVTVSFAVASNVGSMVILSGDLQTGLVNSVLAQPLKARIFDQAGNPKQGVNVTWTVHNGGSLQGTSSTSNLQGEVSTQWKLGPLAGTHTLDVASAGLPTQTFTADAQLPPTGGNNFPNQPPGYVRFAEHNLSSLPTWPKSLGGLLGVWRAVVDPDLAIVVPDTTAPMSPPNVLSMRFPAGLVGGHGPVNWGGWDQAGSGPSGQKSKLYVSLWIKLKLPDYENHPTGTKMGFIGGGQPINFAAHNSWFFIDGSGNQAPLTNWKLQLHQSFVNQSPPVRIIDQNVNTSRLMTAGVWHQWEAVFEMNTLGSPDGKFKWWIDGTLIFSNTDMVYIYPNNTTHFFDFSMNPTWGGGTIYTKHRDDFVLIDHLYMSGLP